MTSKQKHETFFREHIANISIEVTVKNKVIIYVIA